MKIMTKEDLLEFFISIFPEFEAVWNAETNYFRDNNFYTAHGICSEFSHYFRENYREFSRQQLFLLFNKIEENVGIQEEEDEIDNALSTCFLENIAQTESGDYTKQFMGKNSKEYFSYWN